jgi:hypothetical protein
MHSADLRCRLELGVKQCELCVLTWCGLQLGRVEKAGAITSLIKGRLPTRGMPPALWGNAKAS